MYVCTWVFLFTPLLFFLFCSPSLPLSSLFNLSLLYSVFSYVSVSFQIPGPSVSIHRAGLLPEECAPPLLSLVNSFSTAQLKYHFVRKFSPDLLHSTCYDSLWLSQNSQVFFTYFCYFLGRYLLQYFLFPQLECKLPKSRAQF